MTRKAKKCFRYLVCVARKVELNHQRVPIVALLSVFEKGK